MLRLGGASPLHAQAASRHRWGLAGLSAALQHLVGPKQTQPSKLTIPLSHRLLSPSFYLPVGAKSFQAKKEIKSLPRRANLLLFPAGPHYSCVMGSLPAGRTTSESINPVPTGDRLALEVTFPLKHCCHCL